MYVTINCIKIKTILKRNINSIFKTQSKVLICRSRPTSEIYLVDRSIIQQYITDQLINALLNNRNRSITLYLKFVKFCNTHTYLPGIKVTYTQNENC